MGIGAIATKKKHAARTFDLSDVCFIEGKSTQVEKNPPRVSGFGWRRQLRVEK